MVDTANLYTELNSLPHVMMLSLDNLSMFPWIFYYTVMAANVLDVLGTTASDVFLYGLGEYLC